MASFPYPYAEIGVSQGPIIPEDATNLLQHSMTISSILRAQLWFKFITSAYKDYSLVLVYSHKGYLCLSSCLLLWRQHDRKSFQPCKEKKQEPKLLRQYNKEWVPPELTGISWVGKGFKRECIFMLSWLLRNKQDAEAGSRWTWAERETKGWIDGWMKNVNFGGPHLSCLSH